MKKAAVEEATFDSLLGEHRLSGVDLGTEQIGGEDANTISFTVDNKTYTAKEDPNDGYRSSLGTFTVSNEKCKNNFKSQRVIGTLTGAENAVLSFVDAKTGKIVLRVGTDHADDYYPSFVSEFTPENMAINAAKHGVKP